MSRPESIRFPVGKKADGTLTIVARGANAVMLQHVVPELIERVNRFFGYAAVARITIRHGEIAAAEPRRAPASLRSIADEAPGAELGEGVRAVVDPELRAVLASLAAGIAARHVAAPTVVPVLGKVR